MGLLRMAAMTVATFGLAVPAILLAAVDRGGPRSSALVAIWARLVLRLAGVRVRVEGAEHLPPEGAHVYVSTHESMLDIPALFSVLPPRTRFVAKRELFRIPLFGQAIALLGFIPIDRRDTRSAIHSMDAAGRLARGQRPILVFPEGRRSRDGRLQPFKKGAFALAQGLSLPVVPLACLGGHDVLPSGAMLVRPGEMVVHVGQVLEPPNPAYVSRATLLAAVRRAIESLVPEDRLPPADPVAEGSSAEKLSPGR